MASQTTSDSSLDTPVVLMTRPRADSEDFIAGLKQRELHFNTVISPLMRIVFTDDPIDIDGVRGLIFTSSNGVAAWTARGLRANLPTYVVGPSTALAARSIGLNPEIMAQNAVSLVDELRKEDVQGPLLHLSGRHTRGDVAGQLTAMGVETRRAVLYDQPPMPLTSEARAVLHGTVPVIVPVFSPRTAQLLTEERPKAPLLVAAMSEAVAFNLASLHIVSLKVAARPDSGAMLNAVAALLNTAQAEKRHSGGDPRR
ncbi:uroporphyrinogen-III synthase [Sagittula marina]|uniref:Uroporphyrinogen-III synthase n=1 Tax=Sagittula marina TaxID=943940 RepID=A0A7W6DR66_9RHOB|nr:uroporphyrinogen-III synthase [Sagittula marina]MBB3987711.1 uroporphyrinogen-III synthase [Sagittula marina]